MHDLFQQDSSNDKPVFRFQPLPVGAEEQVQNWQAIEQAINPHDVVRKRKWLRPALAFLLIGGVLSGFFFLYKTNWSSYTIEKTNFAEKRQIILPDSTIVTLNANSSVKMPRYWSETGDREVWFEGEALFEVHKKPLNGQKFIVHTNQLDVEVLGTRFNVNTRRSQCAVSLEEGAIVLSLKDKGRQVINKNGLPAVVKMVPGQLAVIDTSLRLTVKNEETQITNYSAWKNFEYHFENTPFREIAHLIEDNYGYKVIVKDQQIWEKSLTGDLRAVKIEEFIAVLEIALKIKMRVEGKTIVITK
jgi:transmembrane sensor